MRKRVWLGGGLAFLALAAGAAVWVGRGAGAEAKPAEATLEFAPYEVVRPERRAMPARLELSGPLVAPNTAIVRAKAAGTLLTLAVGEGDRVRAGQPLGRLDLAELDSRVAEREAAVESARAQWRQAERTHAANRDLANRSFISGQALIGSQAEAQAARANLDATIAQLRATQAGRRSAALRAPIAGLVGKRHALPGEKLAPEQPLLTIVDLRTLELAGSVGAHEVARLAPGQAVEVQVAGLRLPVAGRIARIAPSAEPGTRAIGVAIALPNPDEQLRAGQYATARVELPDPLPRLSVPAEAVASGDGGEHVWVIAGGMLARRSVTTGRRDELQGRVEILDGLAETSEVLAVHFDDLREGRKAVVVGRGAALASAPASAALR